MKTYVFKPENPSNNDFVGELFVFEPEKNNQLKLLNKNYHLNKNSDQDIRFCVVCQHIAEGKSLKSIVHDSWWAPSEYEFLMWVNSNATYRRKYQTVKVMRLQGMTETLFSHVEGADLTKLDAEELKEQIGILKQMTKALSQEVEVSDGSIVNLKVIKIEDT